MLREMPKNKGAMGNPGGQGAKLVQFQNSTAQPTLKDMGIDKHESARYQKIADLPEELNRFLQSFYSTFHYFKKIEGL